jgi:uncharacterized membrane protein
MRPFLSFLYIFTLSLWVGGIAIFTFIVTPAVFRSYGRDVAGEIVGRLFPGYFAYLLVLSVAALLLFLFQRSAATAVLFRVCLALLVTAVLVNAYVKFRLHPEAARIKQEIASFEQEAADAPARKAFRRLHAVSAVLNLFVLLDGAALLALSRQLGRG